MAAPDPDPLQLKHAVRERTAEVLEHLGDDAPAALLQSVTTRFTANSARAVDPSQDVLDRTLLLHTLRLFAVASEVMPSRRRRIDRMLSLASVLPGPRRVWCELGQEPAVEWEARGEPTEDPASWSDLRSHALELPFSGKRAKGDVALPRELTRHLGSSDLAAIDRSFSRYLATEVHRAAHPFALADERSRTTMALAIGLVWDSVLGEYPAASARHAAAGTEPLGDVEVAEYWDRLLARLWKGEDGVGLMDMIRSGYGLQAMLTPRIPADYGHMWHPALADRAFGIRHRGSASEARPRYLRARLPFGLDVARAAHRLKPAGEEGPLRRSFANKEFLDDSASLAVEAKRRTLLAFYQALLKNEQSGGFVDPRGDRPITLASVNGQVRGRRALIVQQIVDEARQRSRRAVADAVIEEAATREGLSPGSGSAGDDSTKSRAVPWAADHLRSIVVVEKFWWLLNRRAGLPEVPPEHVLGSLLHPSFLAWLTRTHAEHEERVAAVVARIARDLSDGRVPLDPPPVGFEEWLRAQRYHYPGPLATSILLWSDEQTGLLPERQRLRERRALSAYLDAMLADGDQVWKPFAAKWGRRKVDGVYLLSTLAGIVRAEWDAARRRDRGMDGS